MLGIYPECDNIIHEGKNLAARMPKEWLAETFYQTDYTLILGKMC